MLKLQETLKNRNDKNRFTISFSVTSVDEKILMCLIFHAVFFQNMKMPSF